MNAGPNSPSPTVSTDITASTLGSPGRRRTSRPAPELPRFFGRYLLLERLGAGGMGEVYRASSLRGPDVAVKILAEPLDPIDGVTRFHREAAAMASLDHPAIVRLLDHGDVAGRPYYAMELLEGVNLRELVEARGPLSAPETLAILSPLTDAVAATHARGLIHRDVKPSNVMIDPDAGAPRPVLVDFGLVFESRGDGPRITLDDALMGTPGYVAPEGMRSARSLSAASDLYGLALITVYLMNGAPPFRPADVVSEDLHHAARERALARLPALPPALAEDLRRSLAYSPASRPTVAELRTSLRDALASIRA